MRTPSRSAERCTIHSLSGCGRCRRNHELRIPYRTSSKTGSYDSRPRVWRCFYFLWKFWCHRNWIDCPGRSFCPQWPSLYHYSITQSLPWSEEWQLGRQILSYHRKGPMRQEARHVPNSLSSDPRSQTQLVALSTCYCNPAQLRLLYTILRHTSCTKQFWVHSMIVYCSLLRWLLCLHSELESRWCLLTRYNQVLYKCDQARNSR